MYFFLSEQHVCMTSNVGLAANGGCNWIPPMTKKSQGHTRRNLKKLQTAAWHDFAYLANVESISGFSSWH